MREPPAITLERFEGPLDLLLELVRRHRVEITSIPIAEITRQYLDYLDQAEAMDLDLGSDFALMAATLIHIKSRMLLPPDPELAAREEDPRQELIRQLLDHQQVRNAADFLRTRLEVASASCSRPPVELPQEEDEDGELPVNPNALNLVEILRLARRALETARTHDLLQLDAPEVTVEQMAEWLEARLRRLPQRQRILAAPLFAEQPAHSHRCALFLAMLEMSKAGAMDLEQSALFGDVWIHPHAVSAAHPAQ